MFSNRRPSGYWLAIGMAGLLCDQRQIKLLLVLANDFEHKVCHCPIKSIKTRGNFGTAPWEHTLVHVFKCCEPRQCETPVVADGAW
jgi:hypothetical protein